MNQRGTLHGFDNPFRPGAGHMPPYLAGREREMNEFKQLLEQTVVLQNLVLTGLRGLGKTVLLETFKPAAIQSGWFWAGADLSESTSISEESMVTRLLTDLSVVTSSIVIDTRECSTIGFTKKTEHVHTKLTFSVLKHIYDGTPGLVADRLKRVLEEVWPVVQGAGKRGIIFAYDEAQNLADHAARDQYPLSLLLDVFQSIQRKGILFMLALTGLPTLFPKLVEARTYTERMFHVIFLDPLSKDETIEAIRKPLHRSKCPVHPADETAELIWQVTRGYPYFVQYICKEIYDIWIQGFADGKSLPSVPMAEIIGKLDTDFFAGRWSRATDRQRDLMGVIAQLPNCDKEFTVQEIMAHPEHNKLEKVFGRSHISQMLGSLSDSGLIYKNRHGKYSFAVPLLGEFIRRQKSA